MKKHDESSKFANFEAIHFMSDRKFLCYLEVLKFETI